MAEAVAVHEGVDVCLIVVQVYGCVVAVVAREVTPIVRGMPGGVGCSSEEAVEYQRPCVVYGPYVVAGTVDIRRADNLHRVAVVVGNLGNEGRNVLIDILSEAGLDQEYMVVALDGLQYAEIVDISVSVKVEIGNGIGVAVEKLLELLHGGRLCE